MTTQWMTISALAQAAWGVMLGWPLFALYSGRARIGPFRDARRLLSAHLDNLFMAVLQLAVAGVLRDVPVLAAALLIAGSWLNPQAFLIQSIAPSLSLRNPLCRALAVPSAASLTVAYPWLLVHYLTH